MCSFSPGVSFVFVVTKVLADKEPTGQKSFVCSEPGAGDTKFRFSVSIHFFQNFFGTGAYPQMERRAPRARRGRGVRGTFAQASQNSALHGHAASFPLSILPAPKRIGQRSTLLQASVGMRPRRTFVRRRGVPHSKISRSITPSRIAVCVERTVPVASGAWHGLVWAKALAH